MSVEGDPVIAESARKHGVANGDILHAYNQPIFVEDLDEGLLIFVGPDKSGKLLEIGIVTSLDVPVIVHAMGARPKYLR